MRFQSSKSCFYKVKENVPPHFKQYKPQGNTGNLVQSQFGSPASKVLESRIAPPVPRGFNDVKDVY